MSMSKRDRDQQPIEPDEWTQLSDKQIRDAMERGEFDNLPGMGKPLRLEHDRQVPIELRLAYRIMRDNDVLPEWISLQKEIEKARQTAKASLQRAGLAFYKMWTKAEHQSGVEGVSARLAAMDARDLAKANYRDSVRTLNAKIKRFNLKVPAYHLTQDLIDPEHEINKVFSS